MDPIVIISNSFPHFQMGMETVQSKEISQNENFYCYYAWLLGSSSDNLARNTNAMCIKTISDQLQVMQHCVHSPCTVVILFTLFAQWENVDYCFSLDWELRDQHMDGDVRLPVQSDHQAHLDLRVTRDQLLQDGVEKDHQVCITPCSNQK